MLSGYTLGGADMLRRAMGKKSRKRWLSSVLYLLKVQKERNQRRTGDENLRPVEKFAGYGFNKSHSAAYALVSYQTLWLKAHYPAEFMAAVMTADMDNTEKVVGRWMSAGGWG